MKYIYSAIAVSAIAITGCMPQAVSTPSAPPPPTWYLDNDHDGWGNGASTLNQATQPAGYVTNAYDCNDNDGGIGPHAAEVADDIDNNCDGIIDEGFNYIFVTSGTYNAELGGADGADAICQAAANAGTIHSGSYKAWMAGLSSEDEIADRIHPSVHPYVLHDGTPVADDFAGLTSSSLSAAIDQNENGGNASGQTPWTNVNGDGTTAAQLFDTTCLDFDYSLAGVNQNAVVGSTDATDATWTDNTTSECNIEHPLICVEQQADHVVAGPPAPPPPAASIEGIYTGESTWFHFALRENGDLFGCGSAGWGTLGIGPNPGINTFTMLTSNVELFAAGMGHSILVKDDGSLWMAGLNGDGQYGRGDNTGGDIFVSIPFGFGDIAKVEGGEHRSFALTTDGNLYGAGGNSAGQLGLGDTAPRNTWTLVATNVQDVKSGRYHTVIQKTDGSLWGAGENGNGQLGLGAPGIQTSFVSMAGGATDIKAFDAGERHVVIIKNDGTVWTAGDDSQGQLGDVNQTGNNINATLKQNATFTGADKVYVGWAFSIIQKVDGTIWRAGQNGNGVLATGNTTPISVWTQLTTPGTVTGIAAGIDSVQYLLDDGSVYAAGRGDDGRLCNGANNTQNTSLVDTGFDL